MIGAKTVKTDQSFQFAEAQFSFGGVGGFGFGIPVFGGSGGAVRGGLFSGGALGAGGGSGIGPLLTLESVFGSGFTDQSVADAIRAAEQSGRFTSQGPATGSIEIATGPDLTLVLNLGVGLFEFLNNAGQKVGGGVTPRAAERALQEGGHTAESLAAVPTPAATFAEPTTVLPGPSGEGEFNELLRGILGALGQLGQGKPRIPGLEPVGIGGTVNVPVVKGSTSDPAGTLRPTRAAFPSAQATQPLPPPAPTPPPTLRQQAVARLIQLLLQLRQEKALRDAQRRQADLIAAANAARRSAMGFGQAGFVGSAAVGPFLGGTLGGLAGDAIEVLLERLIGGGDVVTTQPRLPAFPTLPQLPGQQPAFPVAPGVPGLVGGGGSCPPLFRDGGSVLRMSPTPWFPVQAPNGKWFFFGHLGKPTFSKLKTRKRHHHHPRKR